MVFGSKDSVTKALDARDGMAPSMLTKSIRMMEGSAERGLGFPLWSILNNQGTQTMMESNCWRRGGIG